MTVATRSWLRWVLCVLCVTWSLGGVSTSVRASDPHAKPAETKSNEALGDSHADAAHGGAHPSPSLFTGDLGNAFWTLATFLVVLIVLGLFAWKPLLAGLKNREEFIRKSLQDAKHDREVSESRLREYTEKLNAARIEATSIVEEGRRDADVLKRKIEETARTEAATMIERARREISIATESAVKELHTRAANLAVQTATRIIRKQLDAKEQERLIKESLSELEKLSKN